MVTVTRLNAQELLDMLWDELPELAEKKLESPRAAPHPFAMPEQAAPGPSLPEPFSRGRRGRS